MINDVLKSVFGSGEDSQSVDATDFDKLANFFKARFGAEEA